MSRFLKNLIYNTFISEASKTPLVQRAAEKAARMERNFTGEKLGLWFGATVREVSNDIRSSYKILYAYLNPGAATPQPQSLSTANKRVKIAGDDTTPPKGR
ncbi:hypothetical protein LPMP_250410 [Leishmania panamensis]|uniref:Uncharacterized protein n=1 Tax=Leishmania panamensis TaxID=5679 RepID=A0A088SB72_LEIPA|nr:hypothetical protein LPMP_250410 [Leishmania panamensis]AIN98906.1 hypothetical protein LPMP_250410 [Leishmania panamensis]